MDSLPSIVAVMGTNASGKSALAVRLARHFSGEVVSADPGRSFAGWTWAAARSPEEMQASPPPDRRGPAQRLLFHGGFPAPGLPGHRRVLAWGICPPGGGTGLYLSAVTEGYRLSDKAPDLSYRAELEQLSTATLARMLEEELPGSGIDPDNRNRVMRMLEKLHSGDPGPGKASPLPGPEAGVTWDRGDP